MTDARRRGVSDRTLNADAALSPNDFSKTADNALRLLLLIFEAGPIPTLQLAERSSLHRSVVRRLVNTLLHHGLIWSTPAGYAACSRWPNRSRPSSGW